MPRLACVTMCYNEALLLPVWLRHYGAQAGARNCFVIDHGSTDGSTDDVGGAILICLSRSALDEEARAGAVSRFCNKLLNLYDYVLFTDTDEIIVADPERAESLTQFLEAAGPVTTCIGLDLVHSAGEAPLDLTRPLLAQRAYAAPRRPMCKPSLFRRDIAFTPGFHTYDGEPKFDRLFLFHLAYADRDLALARQAKRRGQLFKSETMAMHHRVDDNELGGWLRNWAIAQPAHEATTFRPDDPEMTAFLWGLMQSARRREHAVYGFDMNSNPDGRWRIPPRFADRF